MKNRSHLLPNVLTALGLTCGLFVIFKVNMAPPGTPEQTLLVKTAAILLLAGFLDLLDGFVARTMKAESDFGGIFDSTSDAITFGLTPSVIVLKSLSPESGSEAAFLTNLAAMVFSVSGVLRLVRFSVNAQKSPEEGEQKADKGSFTGLPIPAAAGAAVSANLFLFAEEPRMLSFLNLKVKTWIMFCVLLLLGYLMVCHWKFPSLKNLHIKISSFKLILLTVAIASGTFWGIFHNFPLFFFILSWGYISIAIALLIARAAFGSRYQE